MSSQILLEAGAKIDAMDHDGNTPLHVKCYGELGQTTELECIEKMVSTSYSSVL